MNGSAISRVTALMVLLGCSAQVYGFEWRDLWQTPAQRAAALYKNGEFERLAKEAPNDTWKALASDANGEHQQTVDTLVGLTTDSDSTQLLYNLATSAVKAGDYEYAISVFDEVLSRDAEYESAVHNKAIAEQLLELQQGEQGEQGE